MVLGHSSKITEIGDHFRLVLIDGTDGLWYTFTVRNLTVIGENHRNYLRL
jgi:hypothetical protein